MEVPIFLKCLRLLVQPIREYGKHNKKYLYHNGIKYEGIYYYPRTKEHQDRQINRAKLLRVQRIKPVKGNPFWEKQILKDLGLDGKQGHFTVVKNIPENNARLWKIKHLIKVDPISFKFGVPTEDDVKHTILKENGNCIVGRRIGQLEERFTATEKLESDPKRLDTELLKRDARSKWLNNW